MIRTVFLLAFFIMLTFTYRVLRDIRDAEQAPKTVTCIAKPPQFSCVFQRIP